MYPGEDNRPALQTEHGIVTELLTFLPEAVTEVK